jgi:zinc D-Ala-D-Ala carboxypeptidase
MTALTVHFTLEEMTFTQVRGVDNSCPGAMMASLLDTAQRMEQVRELLQHPIIVTSGYRCGLVNRIVGGAVASDHLLAKACDFISPGFGSPLAVCLAIRSSELPFDQLILEESWVHLGFASKMRREVLTKRANSGYVAGLRSSDGATV